jgi:hypothetical protein
MAVSALVSFHGVRIPALADEDESTTMPPWRRPEALSVAVMVVPPSVPTRTLENSQPDSTDPDRTGPDTRVQPAGVVHVGVPEFVPAHMYAICPATMPAGMTGETAVPVVLGTKEAEAM